MSALLPSVPTKSPIWLLAKRIPEILPPMSFEESLETTRIHSVAELLPSETGLSSVRPFRSPHHTISDAGLVVWTQACSVDDSQRAARCSIPAACMDNHSINAEKG